MKFNIFNDLGFDLGKLFGKQEPADHFDDLLNGNVEGFAESDDPPSIDADYDDSRPAAESARDSSTGDYFDGKQGIGLSGKDDDDDDRDFGDHNDDGHSDNGYGNTVLSEAGDSFVFTDARNDHSNGRGNDVPDHVVGNTVATANIAGDRINNGRGNVAEKGDHNNDGHPDNGRGNGKDDSTDTGPIVLFTPEDDDFDFNGFDGTIDVADGNMHDALAGNDTVYLPGTQAIADAIGYDTTIAFNGGDGDDIIYGGDTDDVIRTGFDSNPDSSYDYDSHSSGIGSDVVFGGGGDDYIMGDRGHDELHGGDGNDWIWANGDSGSYTAGDSIYGDAGNDVLRGSYGNDTIYGGTGDDYLEGQNGNDFLDGGTGSDRIAGGRGNDTFVQRVGETGYDILNGDQGDDTLRFDFADESEMLASIDIVRDAVLYVDTQDTSAWHYSDAGFQMVNIENVEAYVGGVEIDLSGVQNIDYSMEFLF